MASLGGGGSSCCHSRPGEALRTENQEEFFEKRIRPVLATHCISCHGPERQESSLRLDTRSFLLKGGRSGPVVMPGQPLQSRLYQAVTHRDPHLKMPPPGPLPGSVVEDIGVWIEAGVPGPKRSLPQVPEPPPKDSTLQHASSDTPGYGSPRSANCRLPPEMAAGPGIPSTGFCCPSSSKGVWLPLQARNAGPGCAGFPSP